MEDVFAFQYFHAVESPQGKSNIRSSRITSICLGILVMALYIFLVGTDVPSYLYAILIGGYLLFNGLFIKKIFASNLKANMSRQITDEKNPYEMQIHMEFYEEHLVEVTPGRRIEHQYGQIETVYIQPERYIFLFDGNGAYILPVAQLQNKLDLQEFLDFLASKCQSITLPTKR